MRSRILPLFAAVVDAATACPLYRVRVLLPDGSRISRTLPSTDSFTAVNLALDLYPTATAASAMRQGVISHEVH